jgi:hypothetical protein
MAFRPVIADQPLCVVTALVFQVFIMKFTPCTKFGLWPAKVRNERPSRHSAGTPPASQASKDAMGDAAGALEGHSMAWGTFGPAFVRVDGSPSGKICDEDTLLRILATAPPSNDRSPKRTRQRRADYATPEHHHHASHDVPAYDFRRTPSLAPTKWHVMALGLPSSEWSGSTKLKRKPEPAESAPPPRPPPLASYRNFAGMYRARGALRSPTVTTYIPSMSLMGRAIDRTRRELWPVPHGNSERSSYRV